ncbi:hypothetical protein EG68_02279 [Paragonimus skrjabini miyazakii]|uniref:Uncharacterized protein n=1 Tax=Paragonimus skrjabini miyazakii TaxID=59628 RepID=A0A8S9YZB9_9TREM|nr:hypothetical protein EG68_02279 [Paragonimus skrjabini miyazakii]
MTVCLTKCSGLLSKLDERYLVLTRSYVNLSSTVKQQLAFSDSAAINRPIIMRLTTVLSCKNARCLEALPIRIISPKNITHRLVLLVVSLWICNSVLVPMIYFTCAYNPNPVDIPLSVLISEVIIFFCSVVSLISQKRLIDSCSELCTNTMDPTSMLTSSAVALISVVLINLQLVAVVHLNPVVFQVLYHFIFLVTPFGLSMFLGYRYRWIEKLILAGVAIGIWIALLQAPPVCLRGIDQELLNQNPMLGILCVALIGILYGLIASHIEGLRTADSKHQGNFALFWFLQTVFRLPFSLLVFCMYGSGPNLFNGSFIWTVLLSLVIAVHTLLGWLVNYKLGTFMCLFCVTMAIWPVVLVSSSQQWFSIPTDFYNALLVVSIAGFMFTITRVFLIETFWSLKVYSLSLPS